MAKLPRKLKRKRKQKPELDPVMVQVVLAKIENAKMTVLAKHEMKGLPPCLEAFFEAIQSRQRAFMATGSIHGWN